MMTGYEAMFISAINGNWPIGIDLMDNRDLSVLGSGPEARLRPGHWTSVEDLGPKSTLLILALFGFTDIDDIQDVMDNNFHFLVFFDEEPLALRCVSVLSEGKIPESYTEMYPKKFVSALDLLNNISHLIETHKSDFSL